MDAVIIIRCEQGRRRKNGKKVRVPKFNYVVEEKNRPKNLPLFDRGAREHLGKLDVDLARKKSFSGRRKHSMLGETKCGNKRSAIGGLETERTQPPEEGKRGLRWKRETVTEGMAGAGKGMDRLLVLS